MKRRSSLLGSSMPVSGGSLIDEKNYSIERSHAESRTMKRALTLLSLGLFIGCSLSPGAAYPSDDCRYYDDSYLAWTATGAAAAGLASAAATGAATVGGLLDGTTARDTAIGLGASGAVLGVLATVAGLLAGEYASRFAEECGP
jgi:hypothetical protein